ncbi:MAG: twin-arginine translocation signal domain-containing protein, partial [Candidatus Nanohaloarchaea archaeon]
MELNRRDFMKGAAGATL